MREISPQFIQHATRTWIALTIEVLATAFLFVCFNLVGLSKDISILFTFIVAIISVLIGVKITYKDSRKSSLMPTFRKPVLEQPVERSQSEQKSVEQPQSEQKSADLFFLDAPYDNTIQLWANKVFAQYLTEQSHFERIFAYHLEWHLDFQKNAWSKVEPTLQDLATDKAEQKWHILLKSSLAEQLDNEQGWVQPLVLSLTQLSQIKQKSAQKLLQSPNTHQSIPFLIQCLNEESRLEYTCAKQIKRNLNLQNETRQKWSAFLRQSLTEKNYFEQKIFELLLQELDEQTQSEQDVAILLKQGFDIQQRTEQIWISALVQNLTKQNQFKQEPTKLLISPGQNWVEAIVRIRDEQAKAEKEWIETLLKHTEEDKKVEQKLDEMFSLRTEQQTETEKLSENQAWQDFINSIEQRLEKRIQVKKEVTENLAESLEAQSQVKQEAADLLTESLAD